MRQLGSKGTILSVASAAGFYPATYAPVYAAAKAGVVHLTRSLGPKTEEWGVR